MNDLLFIPVISFLIFIGLSIVTQIKGKTTKFLDFFRFKSFQIGLISLIGLFVYSILFESEPISSLYLTPIIFILISVHFYFNVEGAGEGAPFITLLALVAFAIGLISLIGLVLLDFLV